MGVRHVVDEAAVLELRSESDSAMVSGGPEGERRASDPSP